MSCYDADILLATYVTEDMPEGLVYLNRQVQSLVDQDYDGDIRILVRDDGSYFEDVKSIIEKRDFPANISVKFVEDDLGNLGYAKNFERLMACSEAPYVFFCDQDDYWVPSKVSKCVEKLQVMEREYGDAVPLLFIMMHIFVMGLWGLLKIR